MTKKTSQRKEQITINIQVNNYLTSSESNEKGNFIKKGLLSFSSIIPLLIDIFLAISFN